MHKYLRPPICVILIVVLMSTSMSLPQAQAGEIVLAPMPVPGSMVHSSPAYTPAHLKGITIHPDNALQFDFLMNKGDGSLDDSQKKVEYNKVIKYFLASLTVPDEDQWVNLSPYEHDRIINDNFGKTQMGRDLLAQDYLLKQITSSLMYPESGLGKNFWNKIYERAYKEFGNTNVPVNTFNKVWIVPDEAVVYESGNTAYILKSHLKVMLEEDYLALNKNNKSPTSPKGTTTSGSSQVIREILLPELEREVNEGKNFAQLRQILSGMILASWYKKSLRESLLGKVYADKAKVKGVDQDPKSNEAIYQQYLAAFKKGVYNYVKEEPDQFTRQTIPRKYFAGGFARRFVGKTGKLDLAMTILSDLGSLNAATAQKLGAGFEVAGLEQVTTGMEPNRAMNAEVAHSLEVLRREIPGRVHFNGMRQARGLATATIGFQPDDGTVVGVGKFSAPYSSISVTIGSQGQIIEEFESLARLPDNLQQAIRVFNEGQTGKEAISAIIKKLKEAEHMDLSKWLPYYWNFKSSGPLARWSRVMIYGMINRLVTNDLDKSFYTPEVWGRILDSVTIQYALTDDEARVIASMLHMKNNETDPAIDIWLKTGPRPELDMQMIKDYMEFKRPYDNRPEDADPVTHEFFSFRKSLALQIRNEAAVRRLSDAISSLGFTKKALLVKLSQSNQAMTARDLAGITWAAVDANALNPEKLGGIDMNAANINIQIKRNGQGVPLPLAKQDMAQLNEIQGFVPRIIEIKPVIDLPLLGEIKAHTDSRQAIAVN